jgi:hypothetical protein
MFIFVFTGITLCYSQERAFRSSNTIFLERDRYFTCTNQGPKANKTVVVQVSYDESKGIPDKVVAVDTTLIDKPQRLETRLVIQPYLFMREKNPTSPKDPKVRAFPVVKIGPRAGSVICTKNNYPVFVWGDHAWFIYEK